MHTGHSTQYPTFCVTIACVEKITWFGIEGWLERERSMLSYPGGKLSMSALEEVVFMVRMGSWDCRLFQEWCWAVRTADLHSADISFSNWCCRGEWKGVLVTDCNQISQTQQVTLIIHKVIMNIYINCVFETGYDIGMICVYWRRELKLLLKTLVKLTYITLSENPFVSKFRCLRVSMCVCWRVSV